MVRIAVIEDNENYIQELKDYVRSSKRLTCEFYVNSFEQFKKYYNGNMEIDLVLVDLRLPGKSGIEVMKFIKRVSPLVEILVLTAYNDTKSILQSITNGAAGYLVKHESFEKIEEAIVETVNGGSVLSSDVARRIIAEYNPSISDTKKVYHNNLKHNDIQIIKFIKYGKTYDEIATHLGLTKNGVKYHIKQIYKKLNVKSKVALITKAQLLGILKSDDR